MSVTTVTKTWAEWRLWGQGYAWSTRYTASCVITVTRNTGSDTATVKFDATMTTPSGDSSLGDWQCIPTINGASSGGGEKTFTVASAGYHAENSSYTVSQTYTVGVGVSAGTLTGTIKFRIGGYSGYQGEYSETQSWSLTYDTKGTPSQATWSNYNWGQASTITIQRTVPDFRETVELVWQDDTSHPVTIRTYSQSSATSISYTIPYTSCPTNAKTRSAKIRVKTYNGDSPSATQIGTWETSAVTVSLLSGDTAYLPTISANPVCEAYNDVVSALGTDTAVAQYSKLNVKADSANVYPKYSATIVSYVVTFSNGSTASGSQLNHISSVIQSAGTVNWTYKVTDSRGYTAEKSGSYTVINSSAPSIGSYTVYRGDSSGNAQDGGAYIYATATATCESLNGHNTVTLQGKVGSGSYQNMTNGTRKTLMSNADPNTQYVVTLKATDLLRFTTMDFILPSADCPFHIPSGKHGMGIGMKAQASDNTLYVGYDAKFYGELIKHDAVKNIDIDLVRTTDSLVGGAWTEIPANANLNTETYLAVGKFYCPQNVTVATLSNCPTGGYAFYMIVRDITKYNADIIAEQMYFVREIVTYTGMRYIQEVSHSSGGTNTYGDWYRFNRTLSSESGNVAQWLKASVRRPTSLDFAHIYDSQMVHARLDQSSSSLSGGVNSVFGEGYVLTFMWDTNSKWDSQFFIPDADGAVPAYRCFIPSQNQWGAVKRLVTTEVEKATYTNTSVKNGSAICRRQGNVVDIVATGDVRSLSANTFVTWVTIDAKYRPTENHFVPVASGGVNGRFAVINADGRIQIYSTTAITSAQSFAFNITYIVD